FSTCQLETWKALSTSSDATVAAIAAKAVKEVTYHLDHATRWTLRLGDGTAESHRHMQTALECLWPYTSELFETDPATHELVARRVAADPALLRSAWTASVDPVLSEATLEPPSTSWTPTGGRRGLHTERFGYLLAEMQHLHRAHPGARW